MKVAWRNCVFFLFFVIDTRWAGSKQKKTWQTLPNRGARYNNNHNNAQTNYRSLLKARKIVFCSPTLTVNTNYNRYEQQQNIIIYGKFYLLLVRGACWSTLSSFRIIPYSCLRFAAFLLNFIRIWRHDNNLIFDTNFLNFLQNQSIVNVVYTKPRWPEIRRLLQFTTSSKYTFDRPAVEGVLYLSQTYRPISCMTPKKVLFKVRDFDRFSVVHPSNLPWLKFSVQFLHG